MTRLVGSIGCSVLLGAATLFSASAALAGPDDALVLPTAIVVEGPGGAETLAPPLASDTTVTAARARRLDATLREAVQDLGLTLDVSERPARAADDLDEDRLAARAVDGWVISARLAPRGDHVRLRIVAVAPGSKVVLARSEDVEGRDLEVRAMVMLRDVVQVGRGSAPGPESDEGRRRPEATPAVEARSPGRAVLALNAAALGGYVGLSIQRASSASGDDDKRLVYPLVALGTGIGLGASMIVADEWDVGLGDAWYLSAGAWWPTAAGLLLADSYGVEPREDRYVYGLVGASTGITLATIALTFRGMGEGGATLAHSGGAFGLLLGGMTQLAIEGKTDSAPTRGFGYGAGIGVLGAGVLATQLSITPSRVLLVDLGASLGALTGAAAASPLVFDHPSPTANRFFVGSVAAGTLIGGGVAWFVTRPHATTAARERAPRWTALPYGGVIGQSPGPDGRARPVLGGGLYGSW